MFELLAVLVVTFLAVWGLGELLHSVKLKFLRPKKKEKTILVVLLKEPEAIYQLNHTVAKFRWLGSNYADHIILSGNDLSDKTICACKNIAENNIDFSFCNSANILHIIDSFYEERNGKSKKNGKT